MTAIGSDNLQATRDKVSALSAVVLECAGQAERERNVPERLIEAFRDAGMFRLWVPREFGGEELDLPAFMELSEEVSRLDGAVGWTYMILGSGGALGAFLHPKGAAEVYGTDPNTLVAGAVAPRGRATAVDGGFRVSGRWSLASGCKHASWLIGGCIVYDGDERRTTPAGGPDVRTMVMPASDCEILDTWDSLGLRGTGSHDFQVDAVFVPEDLSIVAGARPYVPGALFRGSLRTLFSITIAPVAIGIARAAIEAFIELAAIKTPTFSQTSLGARPTIHAEVAKAQALVWSARALLYQVAAELMSCYEAGEAIPDELEARRRIACVNAATASAEAVNRMHTLAGATSVYAGNRIGRCLRDIHVVTQHTALSPAWLEKSGQYYLGLGLGNL